MQRRITIKNISNSFLLLLSLLPVISVIYLQTEKLIIQHEMKEKLEADICHEISVREGSYTWVKPGKEIRVAGRLFDIKSARKENGFVVFTGLYDEEEDELENKIRQHQEKNSQPRKTAFFSYSAALFLQEYNNPIPACRILIQTSYSLYLNRKNIPPFCAVLLPPPRRQFM